MFSHFVTLLFIASIASYQVNAETSVAASPTVYLIGGSVEVTFTITVVKGTFTITYGASGGGVAVGTVDVTAGGKGTFNVDGGKPAKVAVDVSVDTKIKVTISSLVAADNGEIIQLAYKDGSTDVPAEDKDFTISLSCPPITGAGGDNINVESSSTGTGCSETNYQFEGCVTVFNCVTGYYAADVSSTCTAGAWATTLPTCEAITCTALTVTGATVTCSDTNNYDSSCTVACDSGTSLSAGTSPVTCGDASTASATGAWSNTAHACTATSCPVIAAPTNGTSTCTSGTHAKDATCTISCNSGYFLTAGTASLTCQDSTNSGGEWSDTTAPVCTAPSCIKIPSPANGTSTCATTVTKVGSSCTITCNEGTKLNGSSPVKCEAGTGLIGKWSNTTDTYSCDAVSGAGMIALNMMLALVLGSISSFMM